MSDDSFAYCSCIAGIILSVYCTDTTFFFQYSFACCRVAFVLLVAFPHMNHLCLSSCLACCRVAAVLLVTIPAYTVCAKTCLSTCFACCRVAAVLLAAFSLCIVLAEATISGALPNLSVFSRILHSTASHQFTTEFLTFVFLCYPCLCAYYAIYKLGRFNFYLLVPG